MNKKAILRLIQSAEEDVLEEKVDRLEDCQFMTINHILPDQVKFEWGEHHYSTCAHLQCETNNERINPYKGVCWCDLVSQIRFHGKGELRVPFENTDDYELLVKAEIDTPGIGSRIEVYFSIVQT